MAPTKEGADMREMLHALVDEVPEELPRAVLLYLRNLLGR